MKKPNYFRKSNGANVDWTKYNNGDIFAKFTAESDEVTLHGLYSQHGEIIILEEIIEVKETVTHE